MVLWLKVLVALGCWCCGVGGILPGLNPKWDPANISNVAGCNVGRSSVICKCTNLDQAIVLCKENLQPFTSIIEIGNCHNVTIKSGAIGNLTALRSVRLYNIGRLELQGYGLKWGTTQYMDVYQQESINVTIENTTMTYIPSYAFSGQLGGIYIKNARVQTMRSFSFSNLADSRNIHLENCVIENIEQGAFKKFTVDNFGIVGGSIGDLSRYSISDVTVRTELRLSGVKIRVLNSQAFRILSPTNFRIDRCLVDSIDQGAFQVSTNGPVFINNNIFIRLGTSPFSDISVNPRFRSTFGKQQLVFDNNTLVEFADGALTFNTSSFYLILDSIVIKRQCSCTEAASWTTRLVRYTGPPGPKDVGKLMRCQKGKREFSVAEYESKHCTPGESMIFIIVGVVVGGLVLSIGIGVVVYFFCKRRILSRYIDVPTDSNYNRNSICSSGSNHVMIVPDGKTYRETELHVIVERVEPITEFVPEPIRNEFVNSPD